MKVILKQLKFAPQLIRSILSEKKTTTLRLFDDKNLHRDNEIICLNAQTEKPFAKVKIKSVSVKMMGELSNADMKGHEKYQSIQEMCRVLSDYYDQLVDEKTEVKVVKFSLIAVL